MRSTPVAILGLALLFAVGEALSSQEVADRDVRGVVVSAGTGDAIESAWITFGDGDVGTYSRTDGDFFLPGAPSYSGLYVVRAIGYEDAAVALEPGVEGQVVELTPDPASLSRLEQVRGELRARTNRSQGVRIFEGEQLAFASDQTVLELLNRRGLRAPRTICLDDAPGGEVAIEWAPHELFRVEALLGGSVVRLYTEEYIQRLIQQDRPGLEVTFPHACV